MQFTSFQSVKSCNWGTKNPAAQTPLIGYFVPDTRRDPKYPFLLRGNASFAPRRNVDDPTILQKAQAALPSPEVCGQATPNWNVSPCRANPRTTITTSASSSMRRGGSKNCGCLDSSEFANERPLLLLGSRPKNAIRRAFLRLNEDSKVRLQRGCNSIIVRR